MVHYMESINATVIAFSGFKRSGKDTLADIIVRKAADGSIPECRCGKTMKIVKTSFAEPFKEMARLVLDIDEKDIEDKEAPVPYTRRYFGEDLSWRQILIRMGEGMKEVICPNVWVLAMENRLYNWMKASPDGRMLAVIPDVRYSQELKLLQKLRKKGFNVRHYGVFRREALPDWWKIGLDPKDKEDRAIIEKDFGADHSEWEILAKNPKLDGAVYNDGSIEDLEADADRILAKAFAKEGE